MQNTNFVNPLRWRPSRLFNEPTSTDVYEILLGSSSDTAPQSLDQALFDLWENETGKSIDKIVKPLNHPDDLMHWYNFLPQGINTDIFKHDLQLSLGYEQIRLNLILETIRAKHQKEWIKITLLSPNWEQQRTLTIKNMDKFIIQGADALSPVTITMNPIMVGDNLGRPISLSEKYAIDERIGFRSFLYINSASLFHIKHITYDGNKRARRADNPIANIERLIGNKMGGPDRPNALILFSSNTCTLENVSVLNSPGSGIILAATPKNKLKLINEGFSKSDITSFGYNDNTSQFEYTTTRGTFVSSENFIPHKNKPHDIKFINCVVNHSGGLGLSIVYGYNISIQGGEYSNTYGCQTGAGISLESTGIPSPPAVPVIPQAPAIWNIKIDGATLSGNYKGAHINGRWGTGKITLSNCTFRGGVKFRYSNLYDEYDDIINTSPSEALSGSEYLDHVKFHLRKFKWMSYYPVAIIVLADQVVIKNNIFTDYSNQDSDMYAIIRVAPSRHDFIRNVTIVSNYFYNIMLHDTVGNRVRDADSDGNIQYQNSGELDNNYLICIGAPKKNAMLEYFRPTIKQNTMVFPLCLGRGAKLFYLHLSSRDLALATRLQPNYITLPFIDDPIRVGTSAYKRVA